MILKVLYCSKGRFTIPRGEGFITGITSEQSSSGFQVGTFQEEFAEQAKGKKKKKTH